MLRNYYPPSSIPANVFQSISSYNYIIKLLIRIMSAVFQVMNKEKSISKHHYS